MYLVVVATSIDRFCFSTDACSSVFLSVVSLLYYPISLLTVTSLSLSLSLDNNVNATLWYCIIPVLINIPTTML